MISIYGDAYTNLAGTDFPFWGQATVVSDVTIEGNTTLKFAGLNFQGIQFASSQDVTDMEFLHMDFWTANSTALSTFLISTGPVEIAYALTVPTSGWTSVDIPISSFSGVDLADVIQMKFDGNGDIYLDNIYFYKSGRYRWRTSHCCSNTSCKRCSRCDLYIWRSLWSRSRISKC